MTKFEDLKGQTIAEITGAEVGSEEIRITLEDGRVVRLYHEQDCCESVCVNDVAGDVADLIGSPVVLADESSSDVRPEDVDAGDSETWTFYRLGTAKGTVVLRWLGKSNGYYSESVDFAVL